MWVGKPKEDQLELCKLDYKHFDKKICERFPNLFLQRTFDMTVSCMFWGFDIPQGWRWILWELCEQLEVFEKNLGVKIQFSQIKEKFGGARFYYDITEISEALDQKTVSEIISVLVCNAENKCNYYCSGSGEILSHDKEEVVIVGYSKYNKEWIDKNKEENEQKTN